MTADPGTQAATVSDGRRFGLAVGGAFLLLGGISALRSRSGAVVMFFTGVAVLLLLGGVFFPRQLIPVFRAWMKLAHVLSRVTTPIFMAVVYFGALTPIGLLRRWFGGNALVTKEREDSYWVKRTPGVVRTMERQF